jgi:hypothetical protein
MAVKAGESCLVKRFTAMMAMTRVPASGPTCATKLAASPSEGA